MLYKPKNGVNFMVVRNVDAVWWNNLIANPLVVKKKEEAPLAIFGKPTQQVELNEHGYMRCIWNNVDEIYALPVDVDNGCSIEEFEREYHRYSHQLYTTYSWHNGKEGARFRSWFKLKEPIKTKWLEGPVKDKLKSMFYMADSTCFDRGHWQVLPCIGGRDKDYRYIQHDGELLSYAAYDFGKMWESYNNDMLAYRKRMEEEHDPEEDKSWMLKHTQNVFDKTVKGERDKTVYNKLMWLLEAGFSYGDVMSLRPPYGFEREYRLKVNRLFNVR